VGGGHGGSSRDGTQSIAGVPYRCDKGKTRELQIAPLFAPSYREIDVLLLQTLTAFFFKNNCVLAYVLAPKSSITTQFVKRSV